MAIDGDRKGIGYWNDARQIHSRTGCKLISMAGKSISEIRCLLGSGQFSIADRPDAFDHVHLVWTARL
jgi:hypothetical protein